MATYITLVIVAIFIFIILIQLNTYLAFIQLPSAIENDPTVAPIVHERYKRDYTVFLFYTITAFFAGLFLLFLSYLKQKRLRQQQQQQQQQQETQKTRNKLLIREWRILNCTFTFKQVFSLGMLLALNGKFLFSEVTISKDDAHLYFQELANRCAQLSIVNNAIAVILSAKLSIVQKYFYRMPDTIHWHQWIGRLAFLEALFHGTFQLQRNYRRQGDIFLTLTTNVRYVTGTCMIVAMVVLFFGSHPFVRQLSYRFFRISHILSFTTLILFGVLHHWCFSIFYAAVLVFWVLDQVDRFYITELESLDALPGNIVRVKVKVPYHVHRIIPGQFVSLSFSPSWINALLYSHSFSICKIENNVKQAEDMNDELNIIDSSHQQLLGSDSNSNTKIYTFYVKANGKRTQALYDEASRGVEFKSSSKLRISQPLGIHHVGYNYYQQFDHIIIVSEGIGMTPWLALLQYLSSNHNVYIDVIWTVRKMDTYYALEDEIRHYMTVFQDRLHIQVYLTGAGEDPESAVPDFNLIQFNYMRPDYGIVLNQLEIKGQRTLLAVCAHEDTTVQSTNIALEHAWAVHTERFEL